MHIVVAIDSFKGSLTSLQAGAAVKEAALTLDPGTKVTVCPMADGGEGTVDALTAGMGGRLEEITVTGPLGTQVAAKYGILQEQTAVLEMSAAAGLTLVPPEKRDPMHTTTYGVGEMITHALDRGCRRFIVGIGGSATNDGGTGMLSALGYRFLDKDGKAIPAGVKGLGVLASIDPEGADPRLAECSFRVACDVTNPLCGALGCSAVYGPQKGAAPESIVKMDGWLKNYSALARKVSSKADPDYPGAGAAGGLGFAFLAFLGGQLESGIRIVLEETKLEDRIKDADLVITGEGRLDGQTVMGKAPIGVAQLAKKYGKQVIAFAGCLGDGVESCNDHGIDAFFSVTPGAMALEEAMDTENAYRNLRNTAAQVFRLTRG